MFLLFIIPQQFMASSTLLSVSLAGPRRTHVARKTSFLHSVPTLSVLDSPLSPAHKGAFSNVALSCLEISFVSVFWHTGVYVDTPVSVDIVFSFFPLCFSSFLYQFTHFFDCFFKALACYCTSRLHMPVLPRWQFVKGQQFLYFR